MLTEHCSARPCSVFSTYRPRPMALVLLCSPGFRGKLRHRQSKESPRSAQGQGHCLWLLMPTPSPGRSGRAVLGGGGVGEDTLPRAARFLSQDCVSPELPLPLPAGCSERPPRLWDLGAFFRSGWFVGRRPEMTRLLSAGVGGPAPFSFHASRRALARAGPHVTGISHTHPGSDFLGRLCSGNRNAVNCGRTSGPKLK